MSDQYKPVSCELHSHYELWIMHGSRVDLLWLDENNVMQKSSAVLIDVRPRESAEYLVFIPDKLADAVEVRLDKILEANEKADS